MEVPALKRGFDLVRMELVFYFSFSLSVVYFQFPESFFDDLLLSEEEMEVLEELRAEIGLDAVENLVLFVFQFLCYFLFTTPSFLK